MASTCLAAPAFEESWGGIGRKIDSSVVFALQDAGSHAWPSHPLSIWSDDAADSQKGTLFAQSQDWPSATDRTAPRLQCRGHPKLEGLQVSLAVLSIYWSYYCFPPTDRRLLPSPAVHFLTSPTPTANAAGSIVFWELEQLPVDLCTISVRNTHSLGSPAWPTLRWRRVEDCPNPRAPTRPLDLRGLVTDGVSGTFPRLSSGCCPARYAMCRMSAQGQI